MSPPRADWVSNEPLRKRFLELKEQGVSTGEIARRIGAVEMREIPQTQRLKRTLGLAANPPGELRRFVKYETAEKLLEALEMDPYEAGI